MKQKVRCDRCGRLVSAKGGVLPKHRVGRSRPGKVKDVCKGSLRRQGLPADTAKPKAAESTPAQSAFADAASA